MTSPRDVATVILEGTVVRDPKAGDRAVALTLKTVLEVEGKEETGYHQLLVPNAVYASCGDLADGVRVRVTGRLGYRKDARTEAWVARIIATEYTIRATAVQPRVEPGNTEAPFEWMNAAAAALENG